MKAYADEARGETLFQLRMSTGKRVLCSKQEMFLGDPLTVKILIPVVDSKPVHSSIERDRYCQKH